MLKVIGRGDEVDDVIELGAGARLEEGRGGLCLVTEMGSMG